MTNFTPEHVLSRLVSRAVFVATMDSQVSEDGRSGTAGLIAGSDRAVRAVVRHRSGLLRGIGLPFELHPHDPQ